MIAIDSSVLVHAVNRYSRAHTRASRVVEDLVNGELPWALPWSVVHDFVEWVTHPRAVARPLSPRDASAFIAGLLESPSGRVLSVTPAHAAVLSEVLGSLETPGELPSGWEVAVNLREHGIRELLSTDRGLRRFAFLSVIDPTHGAPWTAGVPPQRRYRDLRPGRTRRDVPLSE